MNGVSQGAGHVVGLVLAGREIGPLSTVIGVAPTLVANVFVTWSHPVVVTDSWIVALAVKATLAFPSPGLPFWRHCQAWPCWPVAAVVERGRGVPGP